MLGSALNTPSNSIYVYAEPMLKISITVLLKGILSQP